MNRSMEQREITHNFCCLTCKQENSMTFAELKAHLKDVHGIEGQLKGQRQPVMHMDGAGWYASLTKLTLESGIEVREFYQSSKKKAVR